MSRPSEPTRNAEFNDPRLVEVYDAECPWSRDDDFFLALADEVAPARVVDLGCGTGRLAIGMAAAGHRVTGIDPAPASLEAARRKQGSELVTWLHGTAIDLPRASFDLAMMTSHVAQFFVNAAEWQQTLESLHCALVPGGYLAFDSRDPQAHAWERWNPKDSRRRISLPAGAEVEIWTEVMSAHAGAVTFTHHYVFSDSELQSTSTLAFRSESELRESLARAGFTIEHIFGGWNREPAGAGAGEFVVIARS